jgi:arsenate reductase
MAEYLWNEIGAGRWQAHSAGSNPAGYVHPLAIEAMRELGQDLAGAESDHVDRFVGESIDLVVTVCDSAKEACPALPGVKQTLHWPFNDPAEATGTDDEKLVVFREVRDQIRKRIADYLGE